MEKFAAPIIVAVSAYLMFTHDAGFRFESATEEKRVAFVERQAHKAVADAKFYMLAGEDSVLVSRNQLSVRVKVDGEATPNQTKRRLSVFGQACEGYNASYLDKHAVSLRLEFYRDNGALSGTVTLTPRACAPYMSRKT